MCGVKHARAWGFVRWAPHQSTGQTCENGLPGVSFGSICCTSGCGECGGYNCSERGEGLNGDGTTFWLHLHAKSWLPLCPQGARGFRQCLLLQQKHRA